MKKARYIRVSTSTQNTIRQTIKQHSDEIVFIDVISGAIPFKQRPEASKLTQAIEAGTINYITVEAIDRLGRNTFDIQSTIEYLNTKNVVLKVDNLGIESLVNGKPNLTFKMITDVLANVAMMEREASKERQKQGIAIAVAQGKYKGRVKGSSASDDEVLNKYKQTVKAINQHPDLSYRKIASISSVSLATVQKVIKILNKE
ncbi:recombinase family protein [Flavobacterium gilvum]|uniref:Transposase n=1 Tax=Flavobacterium gilvum TaxID=1492737 RepID=A0AAC9N615_9FLAO|nr:recombinase family protein [Flavobacterium gilvum]AOW09912.1 transposase [Flavobacterium gilvum]KFC58307.1 transposase [Flavobacterium gilvum]